MYSWRIIMSRMWYAHCMCCFFMMSKQGCSLLQRCKTLLSCVVLCYYESWVSRTGSPSMKWHNMASEAQQKSCAKETDPTTTSMDCLFGGNFGPRTMASTRSHSSTWKRKLGNRWSLMNTFHAKLWKENLRLVMPNQLVKNYGFFWWRRPGLAIGNWSMLKALRRSPIGACAK